MLTTQSARENATSEDIGYSVFARVDADTLETLDRLADQQVLPRSWLITRILRDWADQHGSSRSDTVDLEQARTYPVPDVVEQIVSSARIETGPIRRSPELAHNS